MGLKKLLVMLPVSLAISALPLDEELKKVESYLIVGENAKAVTLAQKLIFDNPHSPEAHLAYIRALCLQGEDQSALEDWLKNKDLLSSTKYERNVLENLSWAVLSKAQNSPLMPIVVNALQGVSFTNDSKAIPLFIRQLKSPYALVRAIAVRSCSHYGDQILKEQIRHMLKEEKVWYVRLEVISAVGKLRMQECMHALKEIVSSPHSLAEEKMAAILSIVNMKDSVDEKELDYLLSSKRAGLRHLGCALIAYFNKWDKLDKVFALLKDESSDVKIAALNAISSASQNIIITACQMKALEEVSKDPIIEVAVSGAWAAYIAESKEAESKLVAWATSSNEAFSRLATSAITASGERGALLAQKILDKVKDLYAKFNLAFGMVTHRKGESKALGVLLETLKVTEDSYLMWDNSKNPSFNELAPSEVRHIDQIPNYPKIIDQLVRLNILNVLSVREHPKSLEAIRNFLKHSDWGIVAEASALLIQEGDEAQMDEVKNLLNDPDEHVRLQAALVLAFVGSDTSSLPVLMEVFPKVSREQKIQIMMALGHIGEPSAIPFFLQVMQEPFQQLKVIAATCIIQILYH